MAGYTLVFQTVSQARSALLSSPEFVSSGRGDSLFLVQFKRQYTGNLLRFLPTTLKLQYSRTSRKRPPKMQRLSGRLQESNLTGPLTRRGPGTSTLWKIIHCMQCLSYDMCSCHQCSLYILSSIVHTANIGIRQCVKVKNNRKSSTVRPKSGRGRIQEVPTLRLWLAKMVYWIGGRLWEVVTYER